MEIAILVSVILNIVLTAAIGASLSSIDDTLAMAAALYEENDKR